MSNKFNENEYTAYQVNYLDCVDGDTMELLASQKESFAAFIDSLSDEQLDYSYQEGKWTMRQLIMHIIDCEAIFSYRALAISRGERQILPGFDQDEYIDDSDYSHLTKEYLINYFTITRYFTLVLFKGMTEEQMLMIGKVSDYQMSVRVVADIIVGHLEYHLKIIRERYGIDA